MSFTQQNRPVEASSPRLRELVGSAFEERYDCDRFTATVLTNRFGFIIEHLVTRILTTAFSPIVRTGADFAVCLLGAPEQGYPMVALSNTIPVFTGSLSDAVRISLEEYGLKKLRPGDVVVVNDYYRVGTHANDTCFIRPIFRDDKIIAVITIRAHMMDMGGITPGGFGLAKRNVYEDGLRLPPMLLFSQGEPVAATFRLIFANTRFGTTIFPDIQSIKASLAMADELIQESVDKYGVPTIHGAIRYTCDASAETMGDALRSIADGVYEGEDFLESDGLPNSPEYRVKVRVHKVGDRIEFDWSGSSQSSRAALNASWLDSKTAIAVGLKCLIEPYARMTSGTLRNVDIVLPPDAIVNPAPPHACQYYFAVVSSMMMAIFKALMPAIGEKGFGVEGIQTLNFVAGTRENGTQWATSTGSRAAWGASQFGDGDSSQSTSLFNSITTGVEDKEREGFALALRDEVLLDSGGCGEYRGGSATVKDDHMFFSGVHVCAHFSVSRPPGGGGAVGGKPGLLGGAWFWDPADGKFDPQEQLPITKDHPIYRSGKPMLGVISPTTGCLDPNGELVPCGTGVPAPVNAMVRVITNGGGGWGTPFRRDPQRVLRDVRDGYVSQEGAARDYGVVVLGDPLWDPEGLTIDASGTAKLRNQPERATG